MGSSPAPVVSGPSAEELAQRQSQFDITTALQRETQANQLDLQRQQLALQKEAQTRQSEGQRREAQIAANTSRKDTLLSRATDVAAQNENSLMNNFNTDQMAQTENNLNVAKERQKKATNTASEDRTNFISNLMRSKTSYG